MSLRSLSICLVVSLAAVIGCGGGAESEKKASQKPTSYETPEAVFAAFAKAMARDDWSSAVGMLTPESQTMMVVGMVMQASFIPMQDEKEGEAKGKELVALFTSHGLDEELVGEKAEMDDVQGIAKVVKDLPGFVSDLAAWIKKNEKTDEDDGFPKMEKLSDLKIEGDKATGEVTVSRKGATSGQPLQFRKVDGSWKVHLAMGPPPEPKVDDLGIDFDAKDVGAIGSLNHGEKTTGLNHAIAYRAKFFDRPCIVLTLTEVEISDEKISELEKQAKAGEDFSFFPKGPHVRLTLSPEGKLLSLNAWVDDTSFSSNLDVALDIDVTDNSIVGRAGMPPKAFGERTLGFKAKFEAPLKF